MKKGEAEARSLTRKEASFSFDLSQGPLFRVMLLKLHDKDHILQITMHHIIADGWSLRILSRELSAFYKAFSLKTAPELPDLPIQYADYAVWQRHWMQGETLETQLDYWKTTLQGASPLLELPTDRPRPSVQSFKGCKQSFELSKEQTRHLEDLGRQEGATLFMVMLTVFKVMLYRYTGQHDVVVGSPVANRNRTDVEDLIGLFVNTLVLRTHFSDGPDFMTLLQQVRDTTVDAYTHQDLSFEKLVEVLQPERDLSRNPLFQVFFTLAASQADELTLSGITATPILPELDISKFDLSLFIQHTGDGLQGIIDYNTDLFDDATITRMMDPL